MKHDVRDALTMDERDIVRLARHEVAMGSLFVLPGLVTILLGALDRLAPEPTPQPEATE